MARQPRSFDEAAEVVRNLAREHVPSARIVGESAPVLPSRPEEIGPVLVTRLAMKAHDAAVRDLMREHCARMRGMKAPERYGYLEGLAAWSGLTAALFTLAYEVQCAAGERGERVNFQLGEQVIAEQLAALQLVARPAGE